MAVDAALLIIDVQVGLDDPAQGERNNPGAEKRIAALLDGWRRHELPVIHIQHDSIEADSRLRPELPGNAIKPEARPLPEETVVRKHTNSAFVGTGLEQVLRARGIERLVIAGLTTDHCVSASVRSAADHGFDVTLAHDACAAFGRTGFDGRFYTGDEIHRINLVSLDREFCRLRSSKELLVDLGDLA